MRTIPARGEVWLIDFGFAGKTRPALVVSVAFGEEDRALITVVPHTTSLRGSPFEVEVSAPFLRQGAFLVQGVTSFLAVRALCIAWAGCIGKHSPRSSMGCSIGSGIRRSNGRRLPQQA